jgi:hypothetical protein
MRKIVDADFGGEYNTANKAAVLLAYLRHQVDKLAQKVVAANGA